MIIICMKSTNKMFAVAECAYLSAVVEVGMFLSTNVDKVKYTKNFDVLINNVSIM